MGTRDPRIDAYIARSADFARPILSHLRKVVHAGCPRTEETMKWSMPHFMYRDRILCSMAAFKAHCAFGFWKAAPLAELLRKLKLDQETAMGQFGRITTPADLPAEKTLVRLVREAAALNEPGAIPAPVRKKAKAPRPLEIPAYFASALKKNRKAAETFAGFSPSNKREYVEWVTEAKQAETRRRRLETAIEWMAEGKVRNWKYLKC